MGRVRNSQARKGLHSFCLTDVGTQGSVYIRGGMELTYGSLGLYH